MFRVARRLTHRNKRRTVIAVLMNPMNPTVLPDPADLEKAARSNGMQLVLLTGSTPDETGAALVAATRNMLARCWSPVTSS